ncbi:unnamed protein product [Linum tenue]|uniref:RecA family profile 1 domain-containing protein n=1 Tax=Linum tenue TaxID=586396 RepID=A0AAV0KQJ9_9ROSI|nr:unnamed protein product [Linum tenue]
MKFLRSLYSYRMNCLRSFPSPRGIRFSNPSKYTDSIPFISPRGSHPSLQFHFSTSRVRAGDSPFAFDSSVTERGSRSDSGSAQFRRVYNPVRGGFDPVKRNDGEPEPAFSGYVSELEELERNRTYGGAKRGKSGGGLDGKHLVDVNGSVVNRDHNPDSLSSSSVRKQENRAGSVSNGNLSTEDKSRMGLPVCIGDSGVVVNVNKHANGKKVDYVRGVKSGYTLTSKKEKVRTSYVCESCGNTEGQWWGYCRSCNSAGTMKKFSQTGGGNGDKVSGIVASENMVKSWLPQQAGEVNPVSLADVNRDVNHLEWRIPLPGPFGDEVSRVLGGGLVPGSLVLVGGDPGVGKSTLILQLAAIIAEGQGLGKPAPVIYVSGEESVQQIGNRADRMGIGSEDLYLYSSTEIEDIMKKIQNLSPRALIIDSIQTVYLNGVIGSPGGLTQVKECTSALLRFAKRTDIPVLLIGHVTKSGEIAGPRVLEHIVDVVLYVEGEKSSSHRLLRPVKNRFGSTDELGVFEMCQSGLQAVSNPSEIFLSEQHLESDVLAGLAVTVMMDGSRSFLIEIQALCVAGSSASRRHATGIQSSRAEMIIAVLMKQAGLALQENTIFLNVLRGAELTETAGDLAIAVAICSSFLECPIPNNVAFMGEVGLGGELRTVPRIEKRVNTVAKLGYQMCVVPKSAEKALAGFGFEGMKIVGCKNLKEVINTVFRRNGKNL